MKISLSISLLALVVSIFALIQSYQTKHVSDQQIEMVAERTLQVREQAFIKEFRPRFQVMFAELGGEFDKDWNPASLEELFEPLTRTITNVPESK